MKRITLLLISLYIINQTYGQNIWSFQDVRPNGKIIRLDSSSLSLYVDVSSLVSIEFEINEIQRKLTAESLKSSKLDSLLNTIKLLQTLSKQGLKNLPKLSEELKMLDTTKSVIDRQKIIHDAWNKITPFTLGILAISEGNSELNEILISALNESEVGMIANTKSVLAATNAYAGKLQTRLNEILAEDGIYIQMAATLYGNKGNKVPIHFEGFDDFTPPEYYDPYELKLAPTEEQLKELTKIESISDSINNKGISALFQFFKNNLKDKIAGPLINDFENSIKDLEDQIHMILQQEYDIDELKNKLDILRTSIISIHRDAIHFKEKYTHSLSGSQSEIISGLLGDINELSNQIKNIARQLNEIDSFITMKLKTAPNSIRNVLVNLQTYFESEKIKKIENLKSGFDVLAIEITGYRTIHEINNLTIEFTDKVKKLSLLDLPPSAMMDIKNNAGYREEGDNILLEMRGGRPNEEPITLGKQYFTLMMTQPHIVTNVGLMFVNQINNNSQGKFTASPGSSILFKFGTKGKNPYYRKFLDFGLGLNFTTLNFSESNDLEIGAGFIGSAFKDYFQSGIGYNLTEGGWYYMFGFRIPFLNKEFDL
jgi:hypothetical protein